MIATPIAGTNNTDYINSVDYATLATKIKELRTVMDQLGEKSRASRKLRYADIDIEAERAGGALQPDELYVTQHIIDTNIRREQSPYVQYITQSPRAVILEDVLDPVVDLQLLERDLTKKIRFDGWQLSMFANIDSFQANGYSIMELVQDLSTPGEISHEAVQYGDFSFISDTRDLQACEMVARSYYFPKTRLLALCGDGAKPTDFSRAQVDKVIGSAPTDDATANDGKDKSLYKIHKVMFRVNGVVHVAWCSVDIADDWLRKPQPLFIGRRKATNPSAMDKMKAMVTGQQLPTHEEAYETSYPYFLYSYVISENDTISQLKGRVFLDQNVQEAVNSLLSSVCTQARRASGMYFSKETTDPNDDLLSQKNIFFKSGCIINSKVQAFKLDAPDPSSFSAIQALVVGNQNETSQLNFAVNNRKDSRKTAEEVKAASSQAQILSTVQVVLFSIALRNMYTVMAEIIKSRVLAKLIEVNQQVLPLYARKFIVKPSGDTDVIEKQQLISTMMNAWPVIQNTPAGPAFLSDLIEKMFPDKSTKYLQALQQAQQQQQGAQAQQQQQMMGMMKQMATGIVELAKHKEYFSEIGAIHAFPAIQQSAAQIEQLTAGQQNKQQ